MIEYLRLAFGTVVVLLPGLALGRSVSEVVAWTMGAVFAAWAVVFAVHADIRLALGLLLALAAVAFVARRRRVSDTFKVSDTGGVLAAGVVLGWLLWPVAGAIVGDGLFHEGRVRKLVDLGDLHLRTLDEFRDGGLHPGYAFPLWHCLDALIAWVSGLDPSVVLRHESSLLAPVALAVAWEAGVAVFRSRWAGATLALAQVAIFCFGPGHGGSYAQLAQPGTASRQILAPAAVALFFRRRYLPTALVFGALALVHSTYALFLLIPLLVVAAWEWRSYVAAVVPVGAVLLWLRPVVAETRSRNPSPVERATELKHYGSQLVVSGPHHFRLAPEVFGRSGAVAVAALFLLPVVGLALPRRWAQFVLGGSLLVLLLMEVPWLFVHFADATSLSQARRAAGFAPLPFAFAGALALVVRRVVVVPLALVAGIVLQRLWPGDFEYGLRHGGPAAATWGALVGGAAALAVALLRRPRAPSERHGLAAAAAALFVLPVVVHGFWHWSAAAPTDPNALSARLVHELRTRVPEGSVVIAPVQTSYEIVAAAPLYVVAAPVSHVANTTANDPYARVHAVQRWLRTGDASIARRYGATWAIRRGRLYRLPS
ncbi:MAG TPA: hypothetical protein VE982_06125 [Gaiellaceae bacterium]|nr:hypothetical protein [Gaiellaceae bacterium]